MRYYILAFSLFICLSALYTLNWEWINPYPTGNCLRSVEFIDTLTGILVGDVGTIIKTTDGGESWETFSIGQRLNLYCLCWLDLNNCWAAGDSGLILYSSDGGINWIVQSSELSICFNAISFSDSLHGSVVGNRGVIYYTQNGGNSWHKADSVIYNDLHGVCLSDSLHGWAVGNSGIILATISGGMFWTQQNSTVGHNLNEVEFFNNMVGWVVGYGGTLLKTTDGGVNWYQTNYPSYLFIRSLSVVDSMNLWSFWEWADVHHLCRSTDAGENWTQTSNKLTNDFFSIDFFDNDHGWITGENGNIFSITNQGTTWERKNSCLKETYYNYLGDVFFLNGSQGWFIGDCRYVYKTTDGGESFDSFYTNSDYFKDIFFVDENNGCISGTAQDPADVLVSNMNSTDGGMTWNEGGQIDNIEDIYFVSESLGWAIRIYYPNRIFKTSNLGNDWVYVSDILFSAYSVHFESPSHGWVVGSGGNIAVTTDSGATWTSQTSNTNNVLNSVFFLDMNTGFACGNNGTVVSTINGGNQWILQNSNISRNLNKIIFLNSDTGWAVGDSGTIIYTTDGGFTWMIDNSPTNLNLYSVANAGSSYIWVVGDRALVLKAGISSSGVEENQVVGYLDTDIFSVKQNGLTFSINYVVTTPGIIIIDVFDISGRNIVNIINEWKGTGTYSLDYESNFSSGSYFFTISTPEAIQTKQTIYIK